MKKYILIFLFLFSVIFVQAGSHILRPGETLEDVARLYNIPIDSLLKANEGIDEYVGYPIDVPVDLLAYDIGDNDLFRSIRFGAINSNTKKGIKLKEQALKKLEAYKKKGKPDLKIENEIESTLIEAAQNGDFYALYVLGKLKALGYNASFSAPITFKSVLTTNPNDILKGMEWLQMSALLDKNGDAYADLAMLYTLDQSPISDPEVGLSMLIKADKKFRIPLRDKICYMYEEGYGVTQDLLQAYKWCPDEELVAKGRETHREKIIRKIESFGLDDNGIFYGNQLNIDDMKKLAVLNYEDGKFSQEGLYWLQRAALKGDYDSNWMLATVLANKAYKGNLGSDSSIETQTVILAQRAAEHGNVDAKEYVAEYEKAQEAKREHERQLRLERERQEQIKKQERAQMWANIAGVVLNTASQVLYNVAQQKYIESNSSRYYSQNPASSSRVHTPIADRINDPVWLQGQFNMILNKSIMEVQQKTYEEYSMMRQHYLNMGKDLTFDEYQQLKGAAILALKEEGIDIVAEQYEANRKARQEFREEQERDRKNRQQRNKEYLESLYGTSSTSSSSNFTSTTTSSTSLPSTTSSSSGRTTTSVSNSSSGTSSSSGRTTTSVSNSSSGTSSSSNKDADFDSHRQYKHGHMNTNSSDYKKKGKVNLYVRDGGEFKLFRQNVELCVNGSQEFIHIGHTYFLVQIGGSGPFHKHIIFGSKAVYF